MFFLSDRVPAEEALRLGLVNWLHPLQTLRNETMVLARRLASGPNLALGYIKENLNRALVAPVAECLDAEAVLHVACRGTQDHIEAAAAFVEKRTPVFARPADITRL